MLDQNSLFVTLEQAGVWIESRKWFDHDEATRIGFARATLDEIINKHLHGAIQFSAIVDGSRCTLDAQDVGDFVFEIVWLARAGLFNVGSQGNCEVRGRSIQVFLPDKIGDLSSPSSQLVPSAAVPAGVNGYHRVIRQIRVGRQDVIKIWPARSVRYSPTTIAANNRDEVMDALLLAASNPSFPNDAASLFKVMKQTASSFSFASNIELEQFISDECPNFWAYIIDYWNNISTAKKAPVGSSKPKTTDTTDYSFKEHGRLFYKWKIIEDRLLISMREAGCPESHGALHVRIQDIVSSENGGPGRTENDRHFKRYRRFFRATAGGGAQTRGDAQRAKAVRTPANRRSL
jgi:hypothetical protein